MGSNIFAIVALNVLLWIGGCKQGEQPTPLPTPIPPTVAKDTVVRLLFQKGTPLNSLPISRKIHIYKGNVIQLCSQMIVCYNGLTGSIVWQNTECSGDAGGTSQYLLSGSNLVLCYGWQTVAVVSAETGETVWKTTIPQNQGTGHPQISVSGKYVYHTVRSPDKKKCYIRRSPLNYADWDTVATWGMETYTNKWGITADYPPDLTPPTEYVVPNTADTLLYFYNATGITSPGGGWWDYMALHCINAATQNVVWSRPMIDPGGLAGNSVVLYRGKIYVTLRNLACLNPLTGVTLWEYTIGNEGISESFTGNGAFSDGKIAFAPGNDRLHCISAETGQRLWINPDAGQGFEVVAWNNRIWYGTGNVFDLSTGKRIVPDDSILGGCLAVDSLNNRVFTQGENGGKYCILGYQMLK